MSTVPQNIKINVPHAGVTRSGCTPAAGFSV